MDRAPEGGRSKDDPTSRHPNQTETVLLQMPHHLVKVRELRVFRLSVVKSIVNLLNDHCEAKDTVGSVEREIDIVETRSFAVVASDLVSGHHPR